MADLSQPEVSPDDRHHLQRVLRLRPGEVVTASDGRGGRRLCCYRGSARLEPEGEIEHVSAPVPPITIGFALTKGDRPEWTVQKLAEAGVDRILPLVTSRTVVHWEGEKAARQAGRLSAVARGAAMQSRQVWLPVVHPVQAFGDVVASGVGGLAQPGGFPPDLALPTILVGPEGGWDDRELDCGLPAVGLGPTVLRAETAALAAGLLLCALRAGTVRPGGGQ
ncbi:MAG: 16S rRNA (uracil(1498)-N(3))-methyltransferase [Actinomycetota bacterium]|nr:16S rRNA (uracil(1498)-N(3))-methyltransferase [Actinomycetota bacterium]